MYANSSAARELRSVVQGVTVTDPITDAHAAIVTPEALAFVADLHRTFEPRRRELLAARLTVQREIDGGGLPDFLPETRAIRESEWTVAAIPQDLMDRRVEITGPVDRKMVINALNSGANVYMADFEDSHAPTWTATLDGQVNLYDAVRRTITFQNPSGKGYELNDSVATLFVRPRGWHLDEKHVLIDNEPVSASLFDFALFALHNAREQLARGTGPYFYLPKLEHYLEARLWNDVFRTAQARLGLPHGAIRATVLIENILAAFQMDEILWELRDHSAGLNCGRWDYIFSFIKKFRLDPTFVLPDRGQVTMERHFLRAYVDLLIQTCHRRGIHAMGGMAAQIPVKHDPEAHAGAMERVRQDKLREVRAGHDGTWVAHPGLVPVAREVFDEYMNGPNQIGSVRGKAQVTQRDLLTVPQGARTEAGLRHNIDVGIQYLEAWLGGVGCVPIYDLMEDAATAEISRSQVWQWVRHGVSLDDGRTVTADLVRQTIREEVDKLQAAGGSSSDSSRTARAAALFENMMTSCDFNDWLTTVAYEYIA